MSEESRPNPDALLAEIQREEKAAKRGRLKIFFGMCPGVGKTYAMLEAARQRKAEGVDVVIGVVETHGRAETEALLAGLEAVPRKKLEYRGITLGEMDIDALLARRPPLALVDELAHTNAPGSRHPKRYQDVLELLDAGIDVYTTLNVQHLESRFDVVRQFTGITVQETVPDSMVDQADEIELVDLTPEQLRKRLADGKVYMGARAATAAENFFREENLTALREMALRYTAERVDQELRDVMRARRIGGRWTSAQRLAVGIGPSPYSAPLIRWTRRIAAAMDAPWVAVYVETSHPLSEEEKTRLTKNLSLARQLGAEVVMTTGDDVAEALLEAAREQHVTQIVVGKPLGSPLREFLKGGSLSSRLIRGGGDIDVHVLSGEKTAPASPRWPWAQWIGQDIWRDCAWGAGWVAVVTAACWFLQRWTGYWTVSLVYLLAVVLLALVLNRWASLLAAALSALAWNYLFIPPVFTFRIATVHDAMMFATYFIVAVLMGHITHRLHTRELAERKRRQRTVALNRLLESTATSTLLEEGLRRAVAELDALFQTRSVIFLADPDGKLKTTAHPASTFQPNEKQIGVASWTFEREQIAGRFTDTLPDATSIYFPLQTSKSKLGVLGVNMEQRKTLTLDERELLETFAAQIAALIERHRLMESAALARLTEESERLYRTLLDSVSHELKTPLAIIETATEGMIGQCQDALPPQGRMFLEEIRRANNRLRITVSNLLDMTRIETGRLPLNPEWFDVADLFQSAGERVKNEVASERIQISVPADMPRVRLDFLMMEQALANLLTNAAAYSPAGSPIRMSAQLNDGTLVLRVTDHGIGLEPGEENKVFQKFYRGAKSKAGGTGLGLSIVQGFVRAHRGEVSAENNPAGGATFTIRLPVETSKQPL
ncbi:MAG: sensor histidine kinase KdpD [Verrucomicrobia bacterium]|nr:sensor histidine kinase KdpD [Verrucomicrobiota bacterium]